MHLLETTRHIKIRLEYALTLKRLFFNFLRVSKHGTLNWSACVAENRFESLAGKVMGRLKSNDIHFKFFHNCLPNSNSKALVAMELKTGCPHFALDEYRFGFLVESSMFRLRQKFGPTRWEEIETSASTSKLCFLAFELKLRGSVVKYV
jgi:hypothetical protein